MSKETYNLQNEEDMEEVLQELTITDDMGENSDIGEDSDADDSDFTSSSDTSPRSTPTPLAGARTHQPQRSSDTMLVDDDDSVVVSYDIPSPMRSYSSTLPSLTDPGPLIFPGLGPSTLRTLLLEKQISDEIEKKIIYNWTKNGTEPQKFSQITFAQLYGPSNAIAINLEDPFSFFSCYFSEKVISDIVKESNLYAAQNDTQLNLSNNELLAFLGVLIIMGFHVLPNLRLYWSSDVNFHVQRVVEVMCLKRFLKILKFLHLNDNSKMPKRGAPDFDVLYKVSPLVKELNLNFKNSFDPSRYLAIGESMVKFKSGSSTMSMKTGFKVLALCCSLSGYALDLCVRTGKAGEKYEPLSSKSVENLTAPYLGRGHCIIFGNFLTDVPLTNFLLEKDTFSVGTVRSNSKYYPSNLKSAKDMSPMEMDFAQFHDVSVVKWKDRRSKIVSVVSTMHHPIETAKLNPHSRHGTTKTVICPKAVFDYNYYMSVIDRFDQNMEACSSSCATRKWWMRIFFYFLDVSIANSYIIYREKLSLTQPQLKPISQIAFRSRLATNMIGHFTSRQKPGLPPNIYLGQARKKHKREQLKNVPLNRAKFSDLGSHLPMKGTSRRCAFCSTAKKSKRSQIICKKCEVALCLECFIPFHEN